MNRFRRVGMRTTTAHLILFVLASLMLPGLPARPAAAEGVNRSDPLQIIVSLDEQRLRVFRGGLEIASSPISSGKPGNDTPTGIFSILHKSKFHRSNQYSNSPMPWMQRLTWTGIALHESDEVPEFPASHGCVRLPAEFAKNLFDMTGVGEHVVIHAAPIAPAPINHRHLPQPAIRDAAPRDQWLSALLAGASIAQTPRPSSAWTLAAVRDKLARSEAARKPVRVLVTWRSARQRIGDIQAMLMRTGHYAGTLDGGLGRLTRESIARFKGERGLTPANGDIDDAFLAALSAAAGVPAPKNGVMQVRLGFEPLFETQITIADPGRPLGVHVFSAVQFDEAKASTRWQALTLDNRLGPVTRGIHGLDDRPPASAAGTLDRLMVDQADMDRIRALLAPGSSIIVADAGQEKYTGWRTDFVVITRAEPAPKP